MNTAASFARADESSPHILGTQPEVLRNIQNPGVNLCLWQRAPQADIAREVAILAPGQFPDRRLKTTQRTFSSDVTALLRDKGLDPADFKHLLVDTCAIADQFFAVSGDREVRFRLMTIDSDNCHRFHVDTRALRLLCTYRGPGTEWLSDAQVDRAALARGAPNEAVARFGEPFRFETHWVGIMRGEPDRDGSGLVHRSPKLVGTDQTRVVFCLDADPGRSTSGSLRPTTSYSE